MNEFMRERIVRKLETLSDERGYQVLDYIEFLESKYAERQATGPSVFQRFAEGIEDGLRAGKLTATTVAETMGYMSKAMGMLEGVAAAGKSVATDIVNVATRSTTATPPPPSNDPALPRTERPPQSGETSK
jgi:hypothetical protein